MRVGDHRRFAAAPDSDHLASAADCHSALILLGLGLEPTRLLILSQVILSFGIPFALIPLARIAADRDLMH